MDNKPVSNYDLLKRVEVLEEKLDTIINMFEQGKGVLTFLKFLGSFALIVAAIFGAVANWRLK